MVLKKNYGMKDYEKSTLSEFPRDEYVFNYNLSGCKNGGNVFWNDEKGKVVLIGNISDMCYDYFDKYNLSVISNVTTLNVTSTSITVNVTSKKVANGITKSKGTYNEDVTSDNSSAYPSNGVSGCYWYVRK